MQLKAWKGFFMKNAKRLIGIIALVAIIGLTMAACGGGGKLSGTYVDEKDGIIHMTFSGKKITTGFVTAREYDDEGTFELKGGKLYVTIDGETDSGDIVIDGNKFTLDGTTFVKK
jgi:hypothetical protein